jgi:uncharacterized damage-inducible protein DinB
VDLEAAMKVPVRAHSVAVAVFVGWSIAGVLAQSPTANPVSQAIKEGWTSAKRNIAGSAKVMPEDKYGFRPVASVRTFGEIIAHVAGANYIFCAAARGEKPPHAEDAFEKSAKTRAAIVKAWEDSVKYCDAAYDALDDRKLAESISAPFGGGQTTRASALMGNTGHLNEHYGNLVTYLRINGLVPPSSAQ